MASTSCQPLPEKFHREEIAQPGSLFGAIKKTIFVLGSALFLFGTLRNTVTWYFEVLWGSSKDFWQSKWEKIYDLVEGDEFMLAVVGPNVVGFLVYWLGSAFFSFVDLTGRPSWVLRYKIQDNKQVPVDRKKFFKAFVMVLFNQLISIPLTFVFWFLYRFRGCSFGRELPEFHWVLFEVGMYALVEEFFFYYSHRFIRNMAFIVTLFHHPLFYKRFHKMHHEWTAPASITAIYAHPVEHLVANIFPVLVGPLVMGSHIATSWLWFALAISTTLVSHCGYHLPLLPSPEAHDFHHQKFTQCYGVLGVLDWFHGTDTVFRNSRAYDRHVYLLGVTPLKETFPDQSEKCCKKKE